MVKLKNMLTLLLVLSVILMAGCSTTEPDDSVSENASNKTTGNILAVVNGEEITSEEVSTMQQTLLQQGQQVSEGELLEQVINQKLLEQKVRQEGITITTKEAESVIEQELTAQGVTLDDYKQQLAMQGKTYETELENIKYQMATQNYLELQLEGQSFEVTKEEAREVYDVYKNQSAEEIPPYEELESQIMATLKQQKQQAAINRIIQELKATATVEYK